MKIEFKSIIFIPLVALFVGCASVTVTMESKDASDKLKRFAPPSVGNSGLYLYRDSSFAPVVKKDIRVDGRCVGKSAPYVFFYTEVAGGKVHVISTESEFSPNTLTLMTEAGKNYFIRQYLKYGWRIAGADLEAVPEEKGKLAVSELELATGEGCSN